MPSSKLFNFNIGILGHVDSGKTSLAKAISTTSSTAAFDKNPQSQERGITLDLGFSSMTVDFPAEVIEREPKFAAYEKLQFTFVDCPGHASLIRTVIGGAQIIDLILLVVDVIKGVQTQTAECLVLGEITSPGRMIAVLNKIDLLEENKRSEQIEKVVRKLRKTLENTESFKHSEIVPISAAANLSLDELKSTIFRHLYFPARSADSGPFLAAIDHCFPIKGQGTVMTGTVLSGQLKVGDSIEIAALKEVKKVKSMQIYREPVQTVIQGDRVGICVTQFDAALFERGLICAPNSLQLTFAAVVSIQKIPYFKGEIAGKSKFHVSIGHETAMGKLFIFGTNDEGCEVFSFDREYEFQEKFLTEKDAADGSISVPKTQFALLEFEHPVLCPPKCLYIASKLDIDIHVNQCRLAFHGKMLHAFHEKEYRQTQLPALKVFRSKRKSGTVERLADEFTVIVHSLVKKQTNLDFFTGLKVEFSTGEQGTIEGGFGQSGKMKVRVKGEFKPETMEILQALTAGRKKKGKAAGVENSVQDSQTLEKMFVHLDFKRFAFDPAKKMMQK